MIKKMSQSTLFCGLYTGRRVYCFFSTLIRPFSTRLFIILETVSLEQPQALAQTLELIAGGGGITPLHFGARAAEVFDGVRRVLVLACGTSYHAGLVARYWIEAIARLPVTVEIASEYRYRESVPDRDTLVVVISQSGETADTLAALKHAKSLGMERTLAICNVPESAIVRETALRFITRAGPAGERHASTISISLDLKAAARAIRAAGGGNAGAAAILRQEMSTLTAALRAADLTPSGWLEPGDLALILRCAYDPIVAGALERHGDLGRDLATAGPVAVFESWSSLRSDSAHHCVLWISEWPRSLVYPGFLAPLLLSSGVRRTFTLLYTPMRTDQAARNIRKKKTEYISDATQRQRIGQIEDAQQSAEYADVLQQEADLTAGHGLLRATGLIAVSAPTPEELERAVADIEQAAIQASCETRRLWGQQAQAFAAAALPLCRSL